MRISVVIPTLNRGHVIGDAIRTVLAQTLTDFELIVVDDGSTDDTALRVRRVADSRIRYVAQAQTGVAAARNNGVALARAPIIAFLDSDDRWKPDMLEREVGFLERYPEAAAVFADAEKHHGTVFVPSFLRDTPVFSRMIPRISSPDGVVVPRRDIFLCLLEEDPIVVATLTIRRDIFQALGGFDENWMIFEDWEFFIRLARLHRFGFIDRSLAVIHVSADSIHLVSAEWGRAAMIRFLVRERERLRHDPGARAAASRGIARLSKRLGWHYEDTGRRRLAMQAHLRGFRQTGDAGLLVRAAAVWVPKPVRERAKRLAGA